jgi:DNA-binding PadR family transcriptional regulator
VKGLLDLIILNYLKEEPMHGYGIISSLRKDFGVYFGPSTIYPLLNTLEKKGYVKSEWNFANERPRKVYHLAKSGEELLHFTEDSLKLICRTIFGAHYYRMDPLFPVRVWRWKKRSSKEEKRANYLPGEVQVLQG